MQRKTFELLDFSAYVLKIHEHESISTSTAGGGVTSDKYKNIDSELLKEASLFALSAKYQQQLQKDMFALFEALHEPRESYQKFSVNKTIFHPPDDA